MVEGVGARRKQSKGEREKGREIEENAERNFRRDLTPLGKQTKKKKKIILNFAI